MKEFVGASAPDASLASIAVPAGGGGPVLEAALPRAAARLGAVLIDKPVVLGCRIIVARHRDVLEVLRRDLDFRIGPVNATRIDENPAALRCATPGLCASPLERRRHPAAGLVLLCPNGLVLLRR